MFLATFYKLTEIPSWIYTTKIASSSICKILQENPLILYIFFLSFCVYKY